MKKPQELLLLVDTNVWLGTFLDGRANSEPSMEFMTAAVKAQAMILYPAAIAKDVYYLVDRELKVRTRTEKGTLSESDANVAQGYAFSCIEAMRELGAAVGIDDADLWLACRYRGLHPDFEDNIVLAAAERAHADYLVTDDAVLREKSPIAAKSSREMATLLSFWHTA